MNSIEIENFLSKTEASKETYVKIDFPKRNSLYGLFVKHTDYQYLKSKNFWRIVTRQHFDQWKQKKDMSLSRIFNGAEFSRLTLYKDSF
ncbi:MAG: short-chain dehydrogenase [Bacteroidota bacterium]|nr:short-chain dehydrogenase [Flavisolibacter sp.]MDQ3847033.1 short-chain dehydrogenase [Bacteroidota bacterium]MBD0283922.1 short-chain dehydrogenase [Flavisolibacter sp.]MBD0296590.1 short-chain dehydrogenase [Flavisolibacter sp.]MBD0350084.1 short-chain dehydrogenase [Flavisolibacter sp.]